jgi:hypothetical protein
MEIITTLLITIMLKTQINLMINTNNVIKHYSNNHLYTFSCVYVCAHMCNKKFYKNLEIAIKKNYDPNF